MFWGFAWELLGNAGLRSLGCYRRHTSIRARARAPWGHHRSANNNESRLAIWRPWARRARLGDAENRVDHLAVDLVDHDALDRPIVCPSSPSHGRALDLVADDQACGFRI